MTRTQRVAPVVFVTHNSLLTRVEEWIIFIWFREIGKNLELSTHREKQTKTMVYKSKQFLFCI